MSPRWAPCECLPTFNYTSRATRKTTQVYITINDIFYSIERGDILSLLFLQQDTFQRLLHKLDGNRADWEYPFAVAGINISFMLIQMLDLQSGNINF